MKKNALVCSHCGEKFSSDHVEVGCAFYLPDIERIVAENMAFRRVLFTTATQQLVAMHLMPGQEIGSESHPHTTQSMRAERGMGYATANRGLYRMEPETWVTVPPGTQHNVWADKEGPGLWFYVIYSPPAHAPGLVQLDKPPPPGDDDET